MGVRMSFRRTMEREQPLNNAELPNLEGVWIYYTCATYSVWCGGCVSISIVEIVAC